LGAAETLGSLKLQRIGKKQDVDPSAYYYGSTPAEGKGSWEVSSVRHESKKKKRSAVVQFMDDTVSQTKRKIRRKKNL